MKRTALYARVSTTGQVDNYSFENQEADCQDYITRQGDMTVTYRMAEVKSGRTLDREELTKLIALIKAGEIDAVVVGKLDRLSRNVGQLSTIAETCKEFGVELHYADFGKDEDTSMGRMIRNMRGSYAEFEADLIYERTQGGRDAAMKKRIMGACPKAPYGHTFIGKGKEKVMVLQEEEADIIRQMRNWLLTESFGTPRIAAKLTAMGVPTPGGNIWKNTQWSAAGVYRILTEHSIYGVYYHNRSRRQKRGDKRAKPTDPSEWIAYPCDPIITKSEFDAIQRKLAENRELSSRNTKHFYLLGRRVKCACGRSLTGDTYSKPRKRAYRCIGSKNVSLGKCYPMVMVNADLLERLVWDWLITQIEPENLKAGLIAEREKSKEHTDELRRQIAIQERQEKEVAARLERIQEGYNGGFYTLDEAKFQKEQLSPALKSIRDERARLEMMVEQMSRSEEDDQSLMEEAEELYAEARSVTDQERKRWFLDRLNVRVVVERKEKEYWGTFTCVLGTAKQKIVFSSSQ